MTVYVNSDADCSASVACKFADVITVVALSVAANVWLVTNTSSVFGDVVVVYRSNTSAAVSAVS
ncbi:hypothetical protein Poly51_43790 [Rubripirellula tenax]|uniref:Uncharacterized protein n=1 Tax=Rubripirellula tenax TaxID=2528015 RepID=A0A5C6ER29_9BACT|nr:hypothetical protein Poly51_43790 [Rubripirellula tenax]